MTALPPDHPKRTQADLEAEVVPVQDRLDKLADRLAEVERKVPK